MTAKPRGGSWEKEWEHSGNIRIGEGHRGRAPIKTMCGNSTMKGITLHANLTEQTKNKKGLEGKI